MNVYVVEYWFDIFGSSTIDSIWDSRDKAEERSESLLNIYPAIESMSVWEITLNETSQ